MFIKNEIEKYFLVNLFINEKVRDSKFKFRISDFIYFAQISPY